MRHYYGSRRRIVSVHTFLIAVAVFTGVGLLMLTLRSDALKPTAGLFPKILEEEEGGEGEGEGGDEDSSSTIAPNGAVVEAKNNGTGTSRGSKSCATVEEMGQSFKERKVWKESLRVRKIIQQHFALNGIF